MRSYPSISTQEMIQTSSQFAQDIIHLICSVNEEPDPSYTVQSMAKITPGAVPSTEADKTRNSYGRFLYYTKLNVQSGNLSDALSEINKALKIYPAMTQLRVLRASIYVMLRKFDKASADAEDVIGSDTDALDRAQAYCVRAQCDVLKGQYRAALRRLSGAIKLQPHHYVAYLCRANIHLELAAPDKAMIDFRHVVNEIRDQLNSKKVFAAVAALHLPAIHGGNVTSFIVALLTLGLDGLGRVAHNMGAFKKAITFYRQALETDSRVSDIRRHIGEAHEAMGDDTAALEAYDKAVMLNSEFNEDGACNDPTVLRLRAQLHLRHRRWSDAAPDLRLLLTFSPDPAVTADLGECLLQQGAIAEALALFDSAGVDAAAHPRGQLARAMMHLSQGRIAQAGTIINALVVRPNAPALAYLCRAYIGLKDGNLQVALRALASVQKKGPQLAAMPSVKYNTALATALQAIDEGKNAKAHQALTRAHTTQPDEALPLALRSLTIIFKSVAHLTHASVEAALSEVDEAITIAEATSNDWGYTEATQDPPAGPHRLFFMRGCYLAHLGRYEEAGHAMSAAITASDGGDPDYLIASCLCDALIEDDPHVGVDGLTTIINELGPIAPARARRSRPAPIDTTPTTPLKPTTPAADPATARPISAASTEFSHLAPSPLPGPARPDTPPAGLTASPLPHPTGPSQAIDDDALSDIPTERLFSPFPGAAADFRASPSAMLDVPVPTFIDRVRRVLDVCPHRISPSLLLSMRGRLNHAAGSLSAAVADLDAAVGLATSPRAKATRACEKAEALWWGGHLRDALLAYDVAATAYPRGVRAGLCSARIHLELGHWTAAVHSLNAVVQHHPAARTFLFDRDVAALIASLFDCPIDFSVTGQGHTTNRFVLGVLRKLNSLLASDTAKQRHASPKTLPIVDATMSHPWHFVETEPDALPNATHIPVADKDGKAPHRGEGRVRETLGTPAVLPSPSIHRKTYDGLFSPRNTRARTRGGKDVSGLDTHMAFVYSVRGVVNHCIGNARAALEDYDHAIAIAVAADGISMPSQQLVLNKMVALMQLGEFNHALDLVTNCHTFRSNPAALLLKGLMLTHLSDASGAQEVFRELCITDNSYAESYLSDTVRYIEVLPPSLPQIIDLPVRLQIADRDVFVRLAMPSFRATPPLTINIQGCFDPRWLTRGILDIVPMRPVEAWATERNTNG